MDMDIHEIRKRNFEYLLDRHYPGHGQQAKFSSDIGWKPQRTSNLLRGKNMGGPAARLIEQHFELKRGWMDEAHWPLWEGLSVESVSEAKPVYPKPATNTLPVVTCSGLQAFLSGEPVQAAMNWKSIDLAIPARNSFILLEETNALAPLWQPGDVHYVDPDTPAEHGRLAVFVVNGRGMVGIFEKGAAGDRLTFNNPREPVVDVTNATFAGSVTVTFKREFYDRITKS